jgi:hypothetical protein
VSEANLRRLSELALWRSFPASDRPGRSPRASYLIAIASITKISVSFGGMSGG